VHFDKEEVTTVDELPTGCHIDRARTSWLHAAMYPNYGSYWLDLLNQDYSNYSGVITREFGETLAGVVWVDYFSYHYYPSLIPYCTFSFTDIAARLGGEYGPGETLQLLCERLTAHSQFTPMTVASYLLNRWRETDTLQVNYLPEVCPGIILTTNVHSVAD
jgi:hypothetical protein